MRNVPVLAGGLALAGLVGAYAYQAREMQNDHDRLGAQTQETFARGAQIESAQIAKNECFSFVSAISTQRRLQAATDLLNQGQSDAGRTRHSSILALCTNQVRILIQPGLSDVDTTIARRRAEIITHICEVAADTHTSLLNGAELCADY